MTDGEIVREFLEAKDQAKQVKILADENLCTPQTIRNILKRNGVLGEPNVTGPEAQKLTDGAVEALREANAAGAGDTPQPAAPTAPLSGAHEGEDFAAKDALKLVVRAAAVDAIAGLLLSNDTTDNLLAAESFREQVRGVLALVHEIEREAENAGKD